MPPPSKRLTISSARPADPNPGSSSPPFQRLVSRFFPAYFGAFLGLSFLKFGNPPIMENWVTRPTNGFELVLGYPWPMTWGFGLLTIAIILGLFTLPRRPTVPTWLLLLPLLWFGWCMLASLRTVAPELTRLTLRHFAACVACFYLGCFCLARCRLFGFCLCLLLAFALVLFSGWDQHFGGIQQVRDYFYRYIYPTMPEMAPGYLKKISSNRIWGTLFYPNDLAGLILLVLPVSIAFLWSLEERFTKAARGVLIGIVTVASLACLFWSGSKGGWLLLLCLLLVTLLFLPWNRQLKLLMIGLVIVLGLLGFFWRYSAFFQKGATSVSARFDYWRAALQVVKTHPLVGTGPGTFAKPYANLKRPESEMARLVHNDYLEQASDSGVPAFLFYFLFIAGVLSSTLKQMPGPGKEFGLAGHWLRFSVWLGVLGWALQGFFEFGLYIPGLAWPAFALMGWLLASSPFFPSSASSASSVPSGQPQPSR